jgi:hypothetical protein
VTGEAEDSRTFGRICPALANKRKPTLLASGLKVYDEDRRRSVPD